MTSHLIGTGAFWVTGLLRAMMLGGLAVALGGLAGRGVARQYKGERPGPLPPTWALHGSVVGLAASLGLLLTASFGPELAIELARPKPVGLPANSTAVIAIFQAGFFALAILSFRLRVTGVAVVGLLGAVAAEGVRDHPEGVVPVAGAALSYLHILPALTWVGMLAYALRTAAAWRTQPTAVREIMRLYGNAAAWLLVVAVATGVLTAVVLVPVHDLFRTTYGWFVVAKAVLVTFTVGLAVVGRVWLSRSPDSKSPNPPRATRVELAALATVLIVAGLLTVLTPPAKPIRAAASAPGSTASRQWSAHYRNVSSRGLAEIGRAAGRR